jgi:hypothetical protein
MFSFRTMPKLRHLRFLLGMFLFVNISDRYFVSWTRDEMIREAITEKKLVEFDYDGHHRIAELHVYGRRNEANGILAYQIDGKSSKDTLGWKRMVTKKMANLRLLDKTFPGIRHVNGKHSPWDLIYLIVD